MGKIFEILIGGVVILVGGAIGLTWLIGGPFIFFAMWAKSGDFMTLIMREYPYFATGSGRDVLKYGYLAVFYGLIIAWVSTIALLKGRG